MMIKKEKDIGREDIWMIILPFSPLHPSPFSPSFFLVTIAVTTGPAGSCTCTKVSGWFLHRKVICTNKKVSGWFLH